MSDLISRQAAIDTLKNRWKKTRHYEGIGDDIAEECELYLKQVPSAQPSVSKEEMVGDTISRQAAIKAICEDGTMLERQGKYTMTMAERKQRDVDILDTLPSAQPGCEDAVSRADVDILIEEAQTAWLRGDILLMYPALKKGLQKVPPVTPKQPKWTYIEEELPETIINKHTHDFQEYNCLCDFGDYGFDVRTYKYGNGHFWNGGSNVDKYVIAWQSLPEIPDALKPQPWEGEKP